MNIEEIQKKIDETNYWDSRILDINIRYFGDEVEVLIKDEDKEDSCWCLLFESISHLDYTTDAYSRRNNYLYVKSMRNGQIGYYGQNITVKKSENDNFVKVYLDLSIMDLNIVCRKISVTKRRYRDADIFWIDKSVLKNRQSNK